VSSSQQHAKLHLTAKLVMAICRSGKYIEYSGHICNNFAGDTHHYHFISMVHFRHSTK